MLPQGHETLLADRYRTESQEYGANLEAAAGALIRPCTHPKPVMARYPLRFQISRHLYVLDFFNVILTINSK